MMAWMNDEALRQTLETGRTWFWSRSRQEYWRKGETSGDRQYVREAVLRLRRRRAAVRRSTRRARAPATPASGRCFYRTFGASPAAARSDAVGCRAASDPARPSSPRWPRSTRSCRSGARCWPTSDPGRRASPSWSGDGRRASCSSRSRAASAGAATRSSGRDPLATLIARGDGRGSRSTGDGCLAAGLPDDRGILGRGRGAAGPLPRRPRCPTCRRCTAGWSAISATTWCARSSACPTCPPTTSAIPTPSCRSSASWPPSTTGASGSYLIENVARARPGAGEADARRRLRRPPPAASTRLVDDLARPLPDEPVAPPTDVAEAAELPAFRSSMAGGAYRPGGRGGQGAHPGRRHLPGRAVPALRPRARRRPVRRLPGAAPGQPEPVHVLPARFPRSTVVGCLARADGAAARRRGSSRRPIAGTRRRGRDDEHDRRLAGELVEDPKELAEHIMLVDLARNDVGRVVALRHRDRSTS